jgi:hypothetical protein
MFIMYIYYKRSDFNNKIFQIEAQKIGLHKFLTNITIRRFDLTIVFFSMNSIRCLRLILFMSMLNLVRVIVFNATFNNISDILWRFFVKLKSYY